jgi:hypothetical protein
MQFPDFTARSIHFATAILLAMALLLAQWIGLHHGIRHAGLQHSLPSAAQIEADDGDAHHSCIAFDAAALADSISVPPYLAPLLTGVRVLALWTAFASWDAPFTLYFSSRAPPLP